MIQAIITCITKWVSKMKAINLKCPKYNDFYISFLLLSLIGFINSESYCQAPQADRLNNIIPASPTVSEFQKYLDYPVSHTTGIPDISIPIYQINSGSLSLPITLSYHSSGFKIEAQTGVVGLGWVLNAGGMVSRKIVNKPDEFTSYPYPYRYPGSLNQDIESDFFYIGNMHYAADNSAGAPDPEYDVFYYNVGGTNGKFFLATDGVNKRKAVTIPYEPISIKSSNGDFSPYSPAIDYFEITDKNGTIYRFGKSSTNATDAIEKNEDNTTAWFIKEIYSADHSSFIKFTYGTYLRTEIHRSDMWEVTDFMRPFVVYSTPTDDQCYALRNSLNGKIEQHPIEHTNVDYFTPFLSDIEFTGGTVHFDYTGNLFNSDKRLKKITVKNELGNVVKVTDLEQSPTSTGSILELLSSLKSKDVLNNTNEIYNFYYNPETVYGSGGPNSNAVDYWGYFNGQSTNSSLIPPFQLPNDYGGYYTTSYNNKSPNEEAAKTFLLNKVKYPTGGTTEFEYETNKANNINVGGLRIKKMINRPSETATSIIKKYAYGAMEDGQGILLQDPSNIHNYLTLSDYDFFCSGPSIDAKFRVRTISSDLKDGGNLNSGSPVFYSEVAEYNVNLNEQTNGKTVYVYEPPVLYDFFLGASTFNILYEEWKTNHLKNKTDYTKVGAAYVPVKREDYGYYIRNDNPLKCIKVVIKKYGVNAVNTLWWQSGPWPSSRREYSLWNLPNNEPYFTYWSSPGEAYNIVEYEYKAGIKLLNDKATTLYTPTGNIVTTESYTYGTDHNEPLTITTTNSKGETQIVTNKYPHDFISQQPYTDMVNVKHIWSPIVEQSIFKDNINNLLKSAKTNFGFWNGSAWTTASTNQILPQTVEEKIKNNNSETRILFNKYDVKNNLLEQQKKDDVKEVYLWGYNSQYPVAKILNTTHNVAKTYITQSVLDAATGNGDDAVIMAHLNNLRSISGALVTTYTYKPLVGMTSQTDPNNRTTYYSYDAFNRLQLIKDQDGKILKKICYNYAGQQEDCSVNVTPVWTATGNLRCVTSGGVNTGYQEREERDNNPNSPSYNQTQWLSNGYNTSACPLPAAPCSFTAEPGIGTPSYSFYNNGTTVSFYLVFYSSSEMMQGVSYPIGTLSEGCRPSAEQTFFIDSNGATWVLAINPSGQIYATLLYGASSFPPYTTVGTGSTLTYNL